MVWCTENVFFKERQHAFNSALLYSMVLLQADNLSVWYPVTPYVLSRCTIFATHH